MSKPWWTRTASVACIVALAFVAGTCGGSGGGGEPSDETTAIAELKGPNWADYVGQEVVVEGVFITDPVPMLVTNFDLVLVNLVMPSTNYLVLGSGESQAQAPKGDAGMRVRVRGIVEPMVDQNLSRDRIYLEEVTRTVLDRVAYYDPRIPRLDIVPDLRPLLPRVYAVLFSGGGSAGSNHARYWNDLKFMYATLVDTLGVDADNVVVLYGNGTGRDDDMDVDGAGTEADLQTVFNDLEDSARSWDTIFVFTTNHGGGFWPGDPTGVHNYGLVDGSGDEAGEGFLESDYGLDFNSDGDTTDTLSFDETLVEWGASLLDDALTGIIGGVDVSYGRMIIVMEQCFSGGLIEELSQPGRDTIIMAAADELEPSYAMAPDYNYNEFCYHVTCAMNGADHDGNAVDADADDDGRVSLLEVFNYARAQDGADETPQYEDNGDGTPSIGEIVPLGAGTEGYLGSRTWLSGFD